MGAACIKPSTSSPHRCPGLPGAERNASVYGHSYGGLFAFGVAELTSNIDRLVLYEGWPPIDPKRFEPPPGMIERLEALLEKGEVDLVMERHSSNPRV